MDSWIDRILASRTTRAVELATQFTEQRHRVLSENVANIDTPDYHTQRLDPDAFRQSLREALDASRHDRWQRVELRRNPQFMHNAHGQLRVDPDVEPAQNKLFHDGTNARLEQLMTSAAENALHHQLALNLLKSRYNRMMSAIRGRNG